MHKHCWGFVTLADANVTKPIAHTSTNNWCIPWKKLHSIGEHRFLDAHIPYKRCSIYGWWYLLLVDVPYPKSRSFEWWCMPFADVDIAQSMRTHHILYVHALDDNVGCVLTTLDRWEQTTSYTWRHCLVLPPIGWSLLADICRTTTDVAQSVLTCHDCCVQSLAYGSCNWSVSPF